MQSKSILEPIPGHELMGPSLDLSRPELRELMDRYLTPAPARSIVRAPTALIVEQPGGTDQRLKDAMTQEGWTVRSCAGPSGTACPLMAGERCELRESVDVAVVHVNSRGPSAQTICLPRLRCAAHDSSPSVVAIEGSIQSPVFIGRHATIGGLRDPQVFIETIEKLFVEESLPY